jgi:hypothetical protein
MRLLASTNLRERAAILCTALVVPGTALAGLTLPLNPSGVLAPILEAQLALFGSAGEDTGSVELVAGQAQAGFRPNTASVPVIGGPISLTIVGADGTGAGGGSSDVGAVAPAGGGFVSARTPLEADAPADGVVPSTSGSREPPIDEDGQAQLDADGESGSAGHGGSVGADQGGSPGISDTSEPTAPEGSGGGPGGDALGGDATNGGGAPDQGLQGAPSEGSTTSEQGAVDGGSGSDTPDGDGATDPGEEAATGNGGGNGSGNGQGNGNGHGNGNGQGNGNGHSQGNAYGHDKEHAQGNAYGHDNEHAQGNAYGHDNEHGQGSCEESGHGNGNGHGNADGHGNGQANGHDDGVVIVVPLAVLALAVRRRYAPRKADA